MPAEVPFADWNFGAGSQSRRQIVGQDPECLVTTQRPYGTEVTRVEGADRVVVVGRDRCHVRSRPSLFGLGCPLRPHLGEPSGCGRQVGGCVLFGLLLAGGLLGTGRSRAPSSRALRRPLGRAARDRVRQLLSAVFPGSGVGWPPRPRWRCGRRLRRPRNGSPVAMRPPGPQAPGRRPAGRRSRVADSAG